MGGVSGPDGGLAPGPAMEGPRAPCGCPRVGAAPEAGLWLGVVGWAASLQKVLPGWAGPAQVLRKRGEMGSPWMAAGAAGATLGPRSRQRLQAQ